MDRRISDPKNALNKPKQANEIFNEQVEMATHDHRRSKPPSSHGWQHQPRRP